MAWTLEGESLSNFRQEEKTARYSATPVCPDTKYDEHMMFGLNSIQLTTDMI